MKTHHCISTISHMIALAHGYLSLQLKSNTEEFPRLELQAFQEP